MVYIAYADFNNQGTRRRTTTTTPSPPSSGFNVNLKDLLWEFDESRGVGRYIVMSKLRQYVTTTDILSVVDEIRTIDNEKHLDVLIGVGMREPLWSAVVAQKALLMGVS
jgi:hypothetical protein